MSTSDGRDGLRRARECAFALCACWLVVQNVALLTALVAGGWLHRWSLALPVLAGALLLMMPLWLVPAGLLLAGALARSRQPAPACVPVTPRGRAA